MKELTKVFSNVKIPVEIIDEKNMYFTVSAITQKFGKNLHKWKSGSRVKELIRIVSKDTDIKGNLIDTDSLGRTKIHNSLFINFARFISVDFEIASNNILMDILTGETVLCEKRERELLDQIDYKENQLKIAHKETSKAKREAYAHDRDGDFQCVTNIIRDCKANVGAETLNKILAENNIIIEEDYIAKRYKANEIHSISEDGIILVHRETAIKIIKDYNFEYVPDSQMMMDFE